MATYATPESRSNVPLEAHILLAEELERISEHAQSLTGATGVVVALRKSHELVIRTANGIAPDVGTSIPWPSGVTGLCITTKKPQTCASADAEAQMEAAFRSLRVRSIVSVPLEWDGQVRGVLAVLSQTPEAFRATHITALLTLQVVIANLVSQCGLPADAQEPPAPAQVVEIDVDSLLRDPAPEPLSTTPKPASFAAKSIWRPSQPAPPVAPPRPTISLEPAAPRIEPQPPVAPPHPPPRVAPPPVRLVEPEPAPVKINPDVLSTLADPVRYDPRLKTRPATKPSPQSATHSPTVAAHSASDLLVAYRARSRSSRRSSRRNMLLIAGSAVAVLLLGLAIALYPRHKSEPATRASVATEAAAPSAAPSLTVVPLPKTGEQPPVAAPLNTAPAAAAPPPVAVTSAPAAPAAAPAAHPAAPVSHEPTKVAVETPQTPIQAPAVATLNLASHSIANKAVATRRDEVEPPSITGTAALGKALPSLPLAPASLPPAPTTTAVVQKSAPISAVLLRGNPPQYPESAKRLRISGVVKLQVSISADGKVTDVRALSGHPFLHQASVEAVRQWVYRPATLDGKPVASTAEVSVRFAAPSER